MTVGCVSIREVIVPTPLMEEVTKVLDYVHIKSVTKWYARIETNRYQRDTLIRNGISYCELP